MRTDSLGLIFKVEKRLGRGDLFEIISHFADDSKTVSVFQHEFFDGMGALLNESRKWTGAEVSLPFFKISSKASLDNIITGLSGLREDMTPSLTRWKNHNAQAPYSPDHLAWRVFTTEATQRLLQAARAQHISLNTLILSAVNDVIADQLLAQEQTVCRWLIPVNMRRRPEEQSATHNCTSSVGLRFERGASPSEIEKIYRSSLNKWRVLAANALSHAAAHLGEERLYQMARLRGEKNSWIGSFTNLGTWSFPSVKAEDHWPTAISITPPAGTPCFPVGLGVLTWQGHLSLSLRLHAALIGGNNDLPDDLLKAISQRLIDMVGLPLETRWSSPSNAGRGSTIEANHMGRIVHERKIKNS